MISKESRDAEVGATWSFEEFELADELRRAGAALKMTPKALALLRVLVQRGGSVVTRQEIWDTVWPRMVVSDAALTVCIAEIRRVLGDDSRNPRFLATVPRRGYRFIASRQASLPAGVALAAVSDGALMVGRVAELELLARSLRDANAGQRRSVFLVGEPGIGKTTLLEAFKSRLAGDARTLLIEAQCSEHFGPSEPYLPLLDGLAQACRGAGDKRLLDALAVHAPRWLAQLPALSASADIATGANDMPATPERMLRELTDAIEMLATEQLVVLSLEDLHWCDQATLDWLSFVTRRRPQARLLLLMTLRDFTPAHAHAHKRLWDRLPDLLLNANARELKLGRLSLASIEEYLRSRAWRAAPTESVQSIERVAALLHGRTEGNPLYLVKVLESVAGKAGEHFDIDDLFAQLADGVVPDSLRQYLAMQIDRLAGDDIRLLEACSVAGERFSSALVAAVEGGSDEEVERACDELARETCMIQRIGAQEWPDETIASRYAFAHGLYREVLYERIPPGRRARMHRLIGERLERAHGDALDGVASELAMHFGRGHAYGPAARHCLGAGRNAVARAAYDEARAHFENGLDHAGKASRSADECAPELEQELCIALGQTLLAIKGWASSDAEDAFARANRLAEAQSGTSRFLPLWGTAMGAVVRGDFARYAQLGRKLEEHARVSADGLETAAAHWALGQGAFHRGDLHAAERSFEEALRGFERVGHGRQVEYLGVDYQVFTLCYLSHVRWCLGKLEHAVTISKAASALAVDVAHDYSSALALAYAALLDLLLGDAPAAQACVESLLALCDRKGFGYYLGWGRFVKGWARTSAAADSAMEMGAGLALMRDSGARLRLALYQSLLAERHALESRETDAQALLAAALDEMDRTRERCWEPEVMRVQAAITLATPGAGQRAEAHFRQAIAIARSQDALSWELRAAMPLANMLVNDGRRIEARDLVLDVYRRFAQGFDMQALREASGFIDGLR